MYHWMYDCKENQMNNNLDFDLAQQYFDQASTMFARDGGQLWGISLDGPMIFVDYETRDAIANHPDAEGCLSPQANLWGGRIPPEVVLANTAQTWAGVHWTMVIWQSLSSDLLWRAEFMAHEAFHRAQSEIGFPPPEIPNANVHLDTLQGRYWLQLEWRALKQALVSGQEARRAAIADALLFRVTRRALFENAEVEERLLEMHEGLAEYTGFHLSQATTSQAAKYLRNAPGRYPSFVRSFAYASGPAYGLLLDEAQPDWRTDLTLKSDLGGLLQTALSIRLPENLEDEANHRAISYGGELLYAQEVQRDQERQAEIAAYRARLFEGPALILPISPQVQCAFDPRAAIPIPGSGTVFPLICVNDIWGILDVEHGGLWMSTDWKVARVIAPANPETHPLTGNGWRLQLASHWHFRQVKSTLDWELRQDDER
jgi:hypothetical protein